MDASYLVAGLLIGLPVFLAARVVRQFHWDSEARQRVADNLAVSIARADHDVYGFTGSDSDGDGGSLGSVNRPSGRRAIHRYHGGTRLGRYAAGRNLRSADASALI